MTHIGPAVRKRRQRLGWTIQKLATLSGLDGSFVSRLERGESGYSTETEDRIAKTLNVAPGDLHGGFSNVIAGPIDYRRVAVLDYRQAAKLRPGQTEVEAHGYVEYAMTSLDLSARTFGLRVRGDSMEPEFREGDLVIIDPDVAPLPGDFVVATRMGSDALFAKYRLVGYDETSQHVFELVPLNRDYPSWRSDQTELLVVGVMMEHRRPRRKAGS